MPTPPRTFRRSDDAWEAVVARAATENCTPSDIINRALDAYLLTDSEHADRAATAAELAALRAALSSLDAVETTRRNIMHRIAELTA